MTRGYSGRFTREIPRLFCAHCGRQVAVHAIDYTLRRHNQPRDRGTTGPGVRCPGSGERGLRQHLARPGGVA